MGVGAGRAAFDRHAPASIRTGQVGREVQLGEVIPRPISTNPGSMEAGEHRLTRETSFVARRLVGVAVAKLL